MSLIQQIDKWIVKMFIFNERETGGADAAYFPDGIVSEEVNLDEEELIYGCLKLNKRSYYFTSTSLIIKDQKEERIRIDKVGKTNGSFRSGHKMIKVMMSDGMEYNVKIAELPYRLQQLFYQLLEHHSSLVSVSMFGIPKALKKIVTEMTSEDIAKTGFSVDSKVVYASVKPEKVYCHGQLKEYFIYPDDQGVLILKCEKDNGEYEIFNSKTDGYNGNADRAVGVTNTVLADFKKIDGLIDRLILEFTYSIEDHEFEDLMYEMNFKSREDLNNLFSSIRIFVEANGQLALLTEFETQ